MEIFGIIIHEFMNHYSLSGRAPLGETLRIEHREGEITKRVYQYLVHPIKKELPFIMSSLRLSYEETNSLSHGGIVLFQYTTGN